MKIGIVWVTSSTMHSTTDKAIFHSCLKRMIYRLTDGMRWSSDRTKFRYSQLNEPKFV
jgi:hypothetical protein